MSGEIDVPLESLRRVRDLHASVDVSAARIAARLGARLRCGVGCSDCCVDDITVTTAEAASIVESFPGVLAARPHPPGACAMLDPRGACRVYAARPYVCRTQGLPLRWIDEAAGIEHRDICPKNDPPAPEGEPARLEDLEASTCWTLGRAEAVLAAIDRIIDRGGQARRVRLRDLFAAPSVGDESTQVPGDLGAAASVGGQRGGASHEKSGASAPFSAPGANRRPRKKRS